MEINRSEAVRHLSNNEANRITRESICTALLELMNTKSFDAITISELVRRAGVSRQSFYRNYRGKEEVVREIEDTLLEELEESMSDPAYQNDPKLWLIEFFSRIRANEALVTLLQKADLVHALFARIPFLVEDRMNLHTPRLHYDIIGKLGALKAILLEWFNTGMKESEEEMADLCLTYMPEQSLQQ